MGGPFPSPRTPGPGRTLAVSALAAGVLLALRGAQLLSLAPLLYDPEFLQFAGLAVELEGEAGWLDIGLRGVLRDHIYMDFAQGTAWIAVGTALLAPVAGLNVWSLHAVTILSEAAAVALLAALLFRLGGARATALGLAPWLLAPAFAVFWQLLPFGNHTEFLALPLAVALCLTARGRRRPPAWPWFAAALLLAAGVFLYRGNLAAVAALAATALWSRSPGTAALGVGAAASALAIAFGALVAVYGIDIVGGWPDDDTLLPRVASEVSRLSVARDLPHGFPGVPSALGTSLPTLIALGIALAAALAAAIPRPATGDVGLHARRFVALWAAASVAATLVDGDPQPVHRLNALYALLASAALLLSRPVPAPVRRGAVALLLLLAAGGAWDAVGTIHPVAWRTSAGYEGVELWRELRLRRVDPDDLPHWRRLITAGRASPDVGRATHHVEGCSEPLRERLFGPPAAPTASECGCAEPGALGRFLTRDLDADPTADLAAVGRGAWVFCDRDLEALDRALEGMDDRSREALLAGARDEAGRAP